ncbi:MAG: ACP S-malonyltransferase [Chloroflexi bacterium]|nr:ACP S-malonyltransferase [Chloroflexota bacterium]
MADQRLAWLFPGQGAQFAGMGRDLFEGSSAARRVYEAADDVLGYAVTNDCFDGPEEHLQQTEVAQPALYVTSFACLEAAREFDSLPEQPPAFFAGHSLGEYTALAAAGAVGFEDGLRLVQERGRLMQQAAAQQPGAMAALLGLDEAAVRAICEETDAELCNLNAPGQIVIGGGSEAIEAALALALERGARRGVMLKVSGAFHTSRMAPAAEGMARAVANTTFRDPQAPVIANTSGEPMTNAAELTGELVQQLDHAVHWQRSMEYMVAQGVTGVIEFGPGRVLTGLAKRMERSLTVRNVGDLASAQAGDAGD